MNKTAEPIEPAKPVHLAERVQYADGSIVSRALVQKPVGSITLFAFDAGQGLNEHMAPYDAYVQILEGEGEFVIGGQVVKAGSGEAVQTPPLGRGIDLAPGARLDFDDEGQGQPYFLSSAKSSSAEMPSSRSASSSASSSSF